MLLVLPPSLSIVQLWVMLKEGTKPHLFNVRTRKQLYPPVRLTKRSLSKRRQARCEAGVSLMGLGGRRLRWRKAEGRYVRPSSHRWTKDNVSVRTRDWLSSRRL